MQLTKPDFVKLIIQTVSGETSRYIKGSTRSVSIYNSTVDEVLKLIRPVIEKAATISREANVAQPLQLKKPDFVRVLLQGWSGQSKKYIKGQNRTFAVYHATSDEVLDVLRPVLEQAAILSTKGYVKQSQN